MKKTISQRFFLSLCLMIVGCLWGSAAWAETVTYQHVFTAKPSTGDNVTLSGVDWNISATNLNGYNSQNYAGVQLGSSKKDGQITLTSSSDWNYNGKTKITEVRLWLNLGGTSVTPTVTIGGKAATSDGTKVVKNSSAVKDWTKTSKVTFTPAVDGNTGSIVIDVTSVKAGYICALEIDCEDAGSVSSVPSPTFSLTLGTYYGNQTLELSSTVDGGTIYYTTDGTDPSKTSTEYTNPINLTAPSSLTIKAIVMDSEGNSSNVASHTYNILTSIANTQETALTTAEAIDLIDVTTAEQLAAEKVYVKGTISKVDSYNSTYKSITYWLDDNKFEVYSGRGLDDTDFSAQTDIEVGADVIIYGNIKKYKTTYEFDLNNYLVSYSVAEKTLKSVTISGTPTQTTYEVGEAFNTAGLTVTAHYSDDSSKEITSGITWNVTPETLTAGVTSVSVTATVDEVTSEAFIVNGITVRALQSVTLEGTPTKTEYSVGETFDPTGIIVKANYSNSDSEDVTAEATFNYDHSTLTTNTTSMTVTATFGGFTSAAQNYAITVQKSIVPFAPKAIYRKVTSTADIVDGGVYLIVCEEMNEAMGVTNSNKKRCESQIVTLRDYTYTEKVNQDGSPYEITISKATDLSGYYNLYHAEGHYINATKDNADFIFSETGDNGWSISFDASGNVFINNIKASGFHIHRNSGTSNFYKNYADNLNGGKEVQLYQKVGEISVAKATGGITTFASNCDYIMPENLTGYIVTEAAETGTITTKAVYHADEEVPAYTPLIIKSREDYTEEETAKTYNPIALNKSLSYTGDENMLEYTRDENGYTKTSKDKSVYYYKLAIKNDIVGFYWGADNGAAFEMTKPSTAYLTVPNTMNVQGFVLNLEEGEPTGIATVVTNEDAPIYNLQGIRMNGKNLPKGIYIQGGKKFMVK